MANARRVRPGPAKAPRAAAARAEYQRLVDTPETNLAVRAAAGRRLAALRR